jgi:hypothetical protein
MSDEPIPLWDGEPSTAKIIHEHRGLADGAATVRCKRGSPRSPCDGVHVCFSVERRLGEVEYVECPLIDISATGLAVEYDQKLEFGTTGYIAYWTVGHQPVRVSCTIRQCRMLDEGRYLLGIKLDRKLNFEERRPARLRLGREVVPGVRPRKLRVPQVAVSKRPQGPAPE